MPIVSEVGEAVLRNSELTFEWNIRDFFSLSDKEGDCYLSPHFKFADSLWYLKLYPNGEENKSGWVGLYLRRKEKGKRITIHFKFGFKSSDGLEEKEKEREFSNEDSSRGYSKCWTRSELRKKIFSLPDNFFTITCHLRCEVANVAKGGMVSSVRNLENRNLVTSRSFSSMRICKKACLMSIKMLMDSSLSVSRSNRVFEMSRNMGAILEDGKRSDFTLKLGDRDWPVHKVILESRCEYFANMFRHDWVENEVGEVKFDDMEEATLESVLRFVYTGDVEDVDVENVCPIYVAAHKFLLNDLKALCVEYVKENMCEDIFCKVMVIADTYEEKDLNESAIEYFAREAGNIMDTEEWKELKKNHLSIVADLLEETNRRERKKQSQ